MSHGESTQVSNELTNALKVDLLLKKFGVEVLTRLLLDQLFEESLQQQRCKISTYVGSQKLTQPQFYCLFPKNVSVGSLYSQDKNVLKFLLNEIFQLPVLENEDENSLKETLLAELKTKTFRKHLQTRKNTIDRRKKSLNKKQLALLYAKGGVTIQDLDITLLSFLLLNTFTLQATKNQYQHFPAAEETEVADDVLRLRLYRNHLAHIKPIGMNDNEFEATWRDIKGVVSRRLGPETEIAIDEMKTSSLNLQSQSSDSDGIQKQKPDVEVVYEQIPTRLYDRQITREDLEETKSTLASFTQTTVETEGRQIRDDIRVQLESMNTLLQVRSDVFQEITPDDDAATKGPIAMMKGEMQEWEREDDKYFQQTESTQQASKILENTNIVCIIGGPGSGKKMMARHIALELQTHGFEIYSLTRVQQIGEYYKPSENQVFVFINPLGVDSVQRTLLCEWETYSTKLRANIKTQRGKTKLILTMKTQVGKDPKFQNSELFFRKNQYLHRLTCQNVDEKRKMLTKHLEAQGTSEMQTDITDDVLESCRFSFYPLLCKVFAKQNALYDNPNEFIANPKGTMRKIFRKMKHRELHHFCALAIVAIEDENRPKSENEDAKSRLLDMYGLGTLRHEVEIAKEILVDSFLNKTSEGHYEILHYVFTDLISRALVEDFELESFSLLPGNFIHEKVVVSDKPYPEEAFVLVIDVADKQALNQYSNRVVSDLTNGNFETVFGNRNIHRIELLKEIQALLAENEKLLDALKKHSYGVLSWAIKTCNVAFVNILLELGIEVKTTDENNGISPLWEAVHLDFFKNTRYFLTCPTSSSSMELAQLLVSKGADVNTYRIHDKTTPLWWSVYNGNFELTKYLIEKGAEVNMENIFGQSPLWWSFFDNSNTDITDFLLQNNADVNTQSDFDDTSCLYWTIYHNNERSFKNLLKRKPKLNKDVNAVWLAVKKNDTDKALYLLKNGALLTNRGPDGTTPLHWSISHINAKVTKALLKRGADVNDPVCQDGNRTPLSVSCSRSDHEITRILLSRNANVNATCSFNRTAVWLASTRNDESIVRLLMKKNADINIRSSDGTTPFWWSVFNDNTDLAFFLMKREAEVNVQNNFGITPLWLSTYNNNTKLSRCILAKCHTKEATCDVDGTNPLYWAIARNDRRTAMQLLVSGVELSVTHRYLSSLFWAAKNNQDKICFFLINREDEINAKAEDGTTAFYWLVRHNRNSLAGMLLNKNVEVDTIYEKDGTSPLWFAVYHNNVELAENILKRKPRVNNVDKETKTSPLWWAAFHNCSRLALILLELGANADISAGDNTSPLWWSCVRKNITLAEAILKFCPQVSITNDVNQKSPLYDDLFNDNKEFVRLLKLLGTRGTDARTPHYNDMESGKDADVEDIPRDEIGNILILGSRIGYLATSSDIESSSVEYRVESQENGVTDAKDEATSEQNGATNADMKTRYTEDRTKKDRATNIEDRTSKAGDRAINAEDMTSNAEDMTSNAEDMTSNGEDRTTNAEDRTKNAENRALNIKERSTHADDRALNEEDSTSDAHISNRVINAKDRNINTEDSSMNTEDRAIYAEDRTKNTEDRTKNTEEKTINAEGRTINSEGWTINAEDRAINAEDRNTYTEDRTINAEDRNTYTEDRTINAEDMNTYTEDRTINAEDRNTYTEDRTINTKDRTKNTEGRTINAEGRTINAEGRTINAEDRNTYTEDRTINTKDRTINTEDRAINAEDRTINAEDRAIDVENRTINAEDRAINAEDRTINAEDRAINVENRTINAEDRAINAEDRTINAEDRAINAEDRTINAEDRAINVENRSRNTENRAINTEDRTINTEDRTINTQERAINTKDMTTNAEDRAIHAEDWTRNTEDKTINAEDRAINTKDRNTNTEDRTIHAEDWTRNTEDKTINAEDRAINTKDRNTNTEDRTIHAEDWTRNTEDKTIHAEDWTRNTEDKTINAENRTKSGQDY